MDKIKLDVDCQKDKNYVHIIFTDEKTLEEHQKMVRKFEDNLNKNLYWEFTNKQTYLGFSYGNGILSIRFDLNNNKNQNFTKEKLRRIYRTMLKD